MAVTRTGRTIIMTAAADALAGIFFVTSIRLVGDTMTAGQRVIMKDGATSAGGIRVEHVVQAANEDADIFFSDGMGEAWDGLYLDTVPAAGTWKIIIRVA
jgi:hypothetical protein